ncbi:hypothetical protein [Consotaella salsifontis]|uniref:Uncharacterized protein n=1 Tax=Consotaella salsifontis TaxID=1365950 RepID=A0A1T4QN26_9HYPH|nr:hypothetical protein [Consotaella salsifontis]SKA05149.1 hypothetical protein SAMN05428963_105143 [Consotaella salsifontis]
MLLDRRRFLGSLAASCISSVALAQQQRVLRVNGEVTGRNYLGLEAFLFNSIDTVIGLKLRFHQNEDAGKGDVSASVDDGLFVAYLVGGGESEVTARQGFAEDRIYYAFDGFFVVKDAGMHQGITSLFLEKAEAASVLLSGRKVKDIDIDRLNPAIRH